MGKIRLMDFVDDYDEYDELYGGKEKITKKNGKNKNEENLHESQLPVGERVIVISVDEKKQELRVSNFDREWLVQWSLFFILYDIYRYI